MPTGVPTLRLAAEGLVIVSRHSESDSPSASSFRPESNGYQGSQIAFVNRSLSRRISFADRHGGNRTARQAIRENRQSV
jgi:hypothetical protein